ncbi:MAG: SRPBCC family protein [Kineosporiaceae bacterium]|jgi:uncharacterized protein YndB with AHSA1/START domain
MSRVRAVVTVDVDRPPAEVFAYLADVARHSEWSPRPLRVEGVTAGAAVAKGTRFTTFGWLPNDSDHRNDVEVTGLDAPARLELTSSEGDQRFFNTFTVTPHGAGARVERAMDMPRPAGMLGLVFPLLLRALIKPDLAKGLRAMKAKVEGVRR